MDIQGFWDAVLKQDADRMRAYFCRDAYINWHCTDEQFTVEEYIRANCEYPGEWDGEIERVETMGDVSVAVVHVYTCDRSLSFHAVSFMKTENGKILSLDEYWGDDGAAPQWRLDQKIGCKITAAAINQSVNRNRMDHGQQALPAMRTDTALISPQGKASSLLANLMNQKEMLRSSKESLLTRMLDDEDGSSMAGLQEQLEEYEKQLEEIDEQIASEMAKQNESAKEQGSSGQKPQKTEETGTPAFDGGTIAKLTKLSADLEKTQTADQARVRREGEKRVCEAEIELGSEAAKRKLDQINETEQMTEKWMPFWKNGAAGQ